MEHGFACALQPVLAITRLPIQPGGLHELRKFWQRIRSTCWMLTASWSCRPAGNLVYGGHASSGSRQLVAEQGWPVLEESELYRL